MMASLLLKRKKKIIGKKASKQTEGRNVNQVVPKESDLKSLGEKMLSMRSLEIIRQQHSAVFTERQYQSC